MDHAQTGIDRITRTVKVRDLVVDENLALIRSVNAE